MRISPSTALWLASSSHLGVVWGDVISFGNTFTAGGFGNEPIFVVVAPITVSEHTFSWTVNPAGESISVRQVNLVVQNTAVTTSVSTIASACAAQCASNPTTTAFPVLNPADEPPANVPSPASHTPRSRIRHFSTGDTYPRSVQTSVPEADDIYAPVPMVDERRQDGRLNTAAAVPNLSITTTGNTVVVPDMQALLAYQDSTLFFELVWDTASGTSTRTGRSYSRAFTVVDSDSKAQSMLSSFKEDKPFKMEDTGSDPSGVNTGGDGTSSSADPVPVQSTSFLHSTSTSEPTGTTTSAAATTSAAVATMSGNPVQTGSPQPSPSSGGLSKGAIIGIAVAAALVGLGLLAGLVFCLIRRRRRDHVAHGDVMPGVYGGHTPELVAQKEAASAGVEVSPHSPYSDDSMGGGGMVHHDRNARHEEMPLAGYTDHGAARSREVVDGESLRGSGRGSPGRATPTAVRHLVEEGMTEDEIRRLEDEERELDQAIEQASDRRR